jgi:hypothetical protein
LAKSYNLIFFTDYYDAAIGRFTITKPPLYLMEIPGIKRSHIDPENKRKIFQIKAKEAEDESLTSFVLKDKPALMELEMDFIGEDGHISLVNTSDLKEKVKEPKFEVVVKRGKNYYLIVTHKQGGYGDFVIESRVPYQDSVKEVEKNDTIDNATLFLGPFQGPLLFSSQVLPSGDIDFIKIVYDCKLTLDFVSRGFFSAPFLFPDLFLSLLDESGQLIMVESSSEPLKRDPVIFLNRVGPYYITIEGINGSTGYYLLNIRREAIITEIGFKEDFVEIFCSEDVISGSYELIGIDIETEEIYFVQPLKEAEKGEEPGYWILRPGLRSPPGALRLVHYTEVIDSVQFGGEQTEWGEGEPVDISEPGCIGRIHRIDTDSNLKDFKAQSCSPGKENM